MNKILKIFVIVVLFLFALSLLAPTAKALSMETVGNVWRGYSKVLSEDDENENEHEQERSEKRLEIQQKLEGKNRLGIEAKNEKLLLKIESKQDSDDEETELELDDEEELQLQEGTTSGKIKIKAKDGGVIVSRNRVAARTHFPLSLDTNTNELIVTTPAGIKRVTVLPDVAVRNMLANGFVEFSPEDDTRGQQDATDSADLEEEATESGEVEGEGEDIELAQTDDGLLAYAIKGYKTKRFLGIFKVKIKRTVFASVDTGELLQIQENFFNSIIDTLSI